MVKKWYIIKNLGAYKSRVFRALRIFKKNSYKNTHFVFLILTILRKTIYKPLKPRKKAVCENPKIYITVCKSL